MALEMSLDIVNVYNFPWDQIEMEIAMKYVPLVAIGEDFITSGIGYRSLWQELTPAQKGSIM